MNRDSVVVLVISGHVGGRGTVLVDELRLCVHHSHDITRVLLIDLILEGVLAAIVADRSHVERLESAGPRDYHRVEELEAARVLGKIRCESVLSLCPFEVGVLVVSRNVGVARLSSRLRDLYDGRRHDTALHFTFVQAVVGCRVAEKILVNEGVCVGQRGRVFFGLKRGLKASRPSTEVEEIIALENTLPCEVHVNF